MHRRPSACSWPGAAERRLTATPPPPQTTPQEGSAVPTGPYTTDTPIQTVMDDPVFGDYGRLLFPADTGVLERGTPWETSA